MQTTYWPFEVSATQCRVRGDALPRAWADFLGRVPWQLFVTLTFDPKRWPSVDQRLTRKEAMWWCQQVGRLLRRPVAWLVAAEQGRGGRWHAHVLLVGIGDGLGKAPEAMWQQRCGQIDVRPVRGGARAVVYTTKSAALTGEVELSDTLSRYRSAGKEQAWVDLYPSMSTAA